MQETQQSQSQYNPQRRINDNYMPAQNTLSDNFLQQQFLSDTNSFVQYQKIVHQNNPQEVEALNQYYASLPFQQKQFVRPNPHIEFNEQDLPLQYSRFKVPYSTNQIPEKRLEKQALFDNDATLFGRNILSLCENPLIPSAPTHLKNYINILGGIEDTISTMEESLKGSELKNLEDKYINYYAHYQSGHAAAPVEVPPQHQISANPFSKKPSEQNTNIGIIQADQTEYGQAIEREIQEDYQQTFKKEKSQLNPILEQSRKLRYEREKQLSSYKQ